MNNVNRILIVAVALLLLLGAGGYLLSRNMSSSKTLASTMQVSGTEKSESVTLPEVQNGSAVQVTSEGFSPANLSITAGTTVTWNNTSGVNISINSDNHPSHLLYPFLNLGVVVDGGSISLKFDTPGRYGYHNHFNPSQTGTITVQ